VKLRELDQLISRRVGGSLERHGFGYDTAEEWFIRRIPGGSQTISVGIADYEPAFDFSPTFGVRLDAAEELFNRFAGVNSRHQAATMTMVAQSDAVLGIDEWAAESDGELVRAVDEMARAIATRGLAFLDRHTDLESLDKQLNGDDSADRGHPPHREMHALIVAHLTGRADLEALAASYLRKVPADHVARNRLEQLVHYLTTAGELRG
jgi:hypothetical protein